MKPRAGANSVEGPFRIWTVGTLAAVLSAALLLLASCETIGVEDDRESPEAGRKGATLQQIINKPEEFYGKQVTVGGEVGRVLSPSSMFTIEYVGPPKVVVVSNKQLPGIMKGKVREVHEGDLVRVSGTVRPLNIDEIQRDVDYKIDIENLAGIKEGPVIMARAVVSVGRGGATKGSTTQ